MNDKDLLGIDKGTIDVVFDKSFIPHIGIVDVYGNKIEYQQYGKQVDKPIDIDKNTTHVLYTPVMVEVMKRYMEQYTIAMNVMFKAISNGEYGKKGKMRRIRKMRLKKWYGKRLNR